MSIEQYLNEQYLNKEIDALCLSIRELEAQLAAKDAEITILRRAQFIRCNQCGGTAWHDGACAVCKEIARLKAELAEHTDSLTTQYDINAVLKADQSDWRKGVDLIRVSLGDTDPNLSCVRLAEIALTLRSENEQHAETSKQCIAVGLELTSENNTLKSDLDKAVKALRNLINKMDQVCSSAEYQGVFTIAMVHGVAYRGDHWGAEMVHARACLAELNKNSVVEEQKKILREKLD